MITKEQTEELFKKNAYRRIAYGYFIDGYSVAVKRIFLCGELSVEGEYTAGRLNELDSIFERPRWWDLRGLYLTRAEAKADAIKCIELLLQRAKEIPEKEEEA